MKIIIDGRDVEVEYGETILEAARRAGIRIPTLCYNEAFEGQGRCRLCMVEVEKGGIKNTVASCTYPITDEIKVETSTPLIEKMRKNIVMLLYKQAPGSQLIQDMYREYGCVDNSLEENNADERCILCNLCVLACQKMGSSAISLIMRGTDKQVATPYNEAADVCLGCGACAEICPTNAIKVIEKDGQRIIWDKVFDLLNCERCGKPFATREQLAYITAQGKGTAVQNLCESCRRKSAAEKIQGFM